MALLNRILGKDEREEKLKKEIKSLELRKESILKSINNEIIKLQAEQNSLFLDAGKHAYDIWNKDKLQTNLSSYWDRVQELDDRIKEQEAKKKEMTERYDEEIKLISNNLNIGVSEGTSTVSFGTASCPYCGTAITSDDIFCQSCGKKLK